MPRGYSSILQNTAIKDWRRGGEGEWDWELGEGDGEREEKMSPDESQ